jgi:hypothetical protein
MDRRMEEKRKVGGQNEMIKCVGKQKTQWPRKKRCRRQEKLREGKEWK